MERNTVFEQRLAKRYDELKWLYMELYDDEDRFAQLCAAMGEFYSGRKEELRELDLKREADPGWFRSSGLLGMMMYTEQFAGDLKGVEAHLDYIKSCGVNYLHLMPLMESPAGRSDGGYAVSDFRKVQKQLGTVEDLEHLAGECHKQGISLCLDFVMNHTSEDHEWARRARAGEKEYQDRYFFYDSWEIPMRFEKTVPQVFPTTAPGNFTWLQDAGKHVMTTFYPYQWDLNYGNPVVFNEMVKNYLFLTNLGVDVVRLDAVPYIWKELGTTCRNLPQVHTLVRMMRMIGEIVCPGALLLGEVVMEPVKVAPYFGTVEKPECHMLYNVTTMATVWHTVATQDVRLLKKQLAAVYELPKTYTFLNYLRCHDDIGWGLDYDTLEQWGMMQIPHKQFLNDFFTGKSAESFSRGELYNNDPITRDARFCGTTASMCGIEKAGFCGDEYGMDLAIRLDLMLHAFMLFQAGIPVIYSGDEVGQVNDYTYKDDPEKRLDSRYIHRGKFQWHLAENIAKDGTVQSRLFPALRKLETLRASHEAFGADAYAQVLETGNDSVLMLRRTAQSETLTGVFNFSRSWKEIPWNEGGTDLVSGDPLGGAEKIRMRAFDFVWIKSV